MQVKDKRKKGKELCRKTTEEREEEKERRSWKMKSKPQYEKPTEEQMRGHWDAMEPSSRGLAWRQQQIVTPEKLPTMNRLDRK